jgi:two-component system chemotaxis family response regulator WspR
MSENLRVLVVDDQEIILEAVRKMLATAPEIRATYERDSAAAIQTALRVQPHAVLLDVHMAPEDGLSVLSAMRRQPELSDVSVVMLSSAEEPETKVEAFRRGANDYIVKLPSALELIARVRYHARACLASRDREGAFQALLESRLALEQRAREIEQQKALLEQMNRELTESSYTDALTGLRNRRYLPHYLEKVATAPPMPPAPGERARRGSAAGGLVFCMFDLDHFKAINDRHGHEAGDAVLVETARRLQGCLLANDVAMRWGGEEFLVIGRDHSPASARSLARRLLQVIGAEPHVLPSGQSIQVTCSLGYAPLHWQTGEGDAVLSREQIINLADHALYLSKIEGRNRGIGVYPGEDSSFTRRMTQLASQPGGLRDEHGKGVRLQAVAGPSVVAVRGGSV